MSFLKGFCAYALLHRKRALLPKSPHHERHRTRGANRISWTPINWLARRSAEGARLVPEAVVLRPPAV